MRLRIEVAVNDCGFVFVMRGEVSCRSDTTDFGSEGRRFEPCRVHQ